MGQEQREFGVGVGGGVIKAEGRRGEVKVTTHSGSHMMLFQ